MRLLFSLGFYVTIYLIALISISDGSGKHKNGHIYSENIAKDATQRISIMIGGDGNTKNDNSNGQGPIAGIFADGDDDDGDDGGDGSDGRSLSESATYQMCRPDSATICCFQYTWPGFRSKPLDASNATCDYLRKEKKDETFPCFDPLVFTSARTAEDDPVGTPPDMQALIDKSRNNRLGIYCPMTDESCVSLTYYSRSGARKMTNQTKFCGIVTNSNNGQRIENGCHKQNVDGYIREVCVCNSRWCNSQNVIINSVFITICASLASIFNFLNN